jgi:DNA-binding transcriptional ArsR family regulator
MKQTKTTQGMKLVNFNLNVGLQIFKSLGDESRIRILHMLYQKEEMCVSDIELILDFSQTKTSRQLIYLRNAGLLQCRKIDQWMLYSLRDEVREIIGNIFKYLMKDNLLQKDIETYEILFGSGELAVCRLQNKLLEK